jgi:hypothetical protein
MKNLDQIDPLPRFESVGTYTRPDGAQIWSKRQNEEWAKARQKESGEDWQPYKRDGQIVPHTYINGQGKLKTEGYQPPEPPETDIPIPCVANISWDPATFGDDAFVALYDEAGYYYAGPLSGARDAMRARDIEMGRSRPVIAWKPAT